jgi:hypothetical protein
MRRGLLRLVITVVALGLGAAAGADVAEADSLSPALELHLDSLAGGITPDSSGNGLDATAQGTLVSDGRFDRALRMSAPGDSLNVANNPALAPAQVTVMAWVRQSGWNFDQFLVGKPYPAGGCNTDSYALTSGLSSGVRFIVDVADSGGGRQYSTPESSTSSVWDGQWHAIAGTYDGSTVSLYQDGQLVGSTPTGGAPLVYDTNPGNAGLAGLYAGIPSNPNHCVFDQKYSGDIDEIRTYDRALSAQEIATLQAPSATTPPELGDPPTVTAAPAGDLSTSGATLRGTVTPNGSAVTDCHFEYGTSTAYGSSVPCAQSAGSGTSGVPVSATLSGLDRNTTYYFKLVATNRLGTVSDAGTFTTAAIDTEITSGPSGATSVVPTFGFSASVPGATFECRFDGESFAPCAAPLGRYGLALGAHTFYVRAVAPGGSRDPSPATRAFTLAVTNVTQECSVQVSWFAGGGDCTVFNLGADAVHCPAGAQCTLTTTVDLRDGDTDASTFGSSTAKLLDPKTLRGPESRANCQSDPKAADANHDVACPAGTSVALVGNGQSALVVCLPGWPYRSGSDKRRGPDDKRVMHCSATLRIEPAVPLKVVVGGTSASTQAPTPGRLTVTAPAGASGRVVASAAAKKRKRRRPPVAPFHANVKHAGAVTIKLKLSKAAKRTLTRRHKLALRLKLSFKPAGGGKATIRTQRVTLRQPPPRGCGRRVRVRCASAPS